jgi:hypothetical protein
MMNLLICIGILIFIGYSFKHIGKDHLEKQGLSYKQHFKRATYMSFLCLKTSLLGLLHAVAPSLQEEVFTKLKNELSKEL